MAPKRKRSQPNSSRGSNSNAIFADVRYTAEDQATFSTWLEKNGATFEEVLGVLIDDSYRVTLKYDYHNNCPAATITQQEETKHKNSGIILIVRASTPVNAVMLAAWTIFEMYSNGPLPTSQVGDDVWV